MTLAKYAEKSAKIYYEYLRNQDDKGIFSAEVLRLQEDLIGEIEIHVNRNINYPEEMTLHIEGGQIFEIGANHGIQIKSSKKKILRIIATEEITQQITEAYNSNKRISFECDLSFLVERIMNWYEKNGNSIKMPNHFSPIELCQSKEIPLSDNQKSAAEGILHNPFTYIWGAPGTGKTAHVLAVSILSCLLNGQKVLLVAPTNSALDQSLRGLLKALEKDGRIEPIGNIIRLGIPGEQFQSMYPSVCEDEALKRKKESINEEIDKLRSDVKSQEISLRLKEKEADLALFNESTDKKAKLDLFCLVAVTADACIYKIPTKNHYKAEHIFLDEAGFCPVIKSLSLTSFDCPVSFLGDHMQLPPVYEGSDSIFGGEVWLKEFWEKSSIFSEEFILMDPNRHIIPEKPSFCQLRKWNLIETYRFGPMLADLLADRVYDTSFCSKSDNNTAIWFFDASKNPQDLYDERNKSKRISHAEADAIAEFYIRNLGRCSVGILTPYRKQRELIMHTLRDRLFKARIQDDFEENIMTVHNSQGQEWDIILFSITDTYAEKWYTNTDKLIALQVINTAISRARKLLILTGDLQSWKGHSNQFLACLIELADTKLPSSIIPETIIPLPLTESDNFSEDGENDPWANETPRMTVRELIAEKKIEKGQKFVLGEYIQNNQTEDPVEWDVLEADNHKALLLSHNCLAFRAFSEKGHRSFWKKSSIRAWLNAEFYSHVFSNEEKALILKMQIDNSANESRNPFSVFSALPTEDKVFLLSYKETKLYFSDCGKRKAKMTQYAQMQAEKESLSIISDSVSMNARWILRSNAEGQTRISYVDSDGNAEKSCKVRSEGMIRPAIWILQPGDARNLQYLCLNCGKPSSNILCSRCNATTDRDKLCLQLIRFLNRKSENPIWKEIVNKTGTTMILREWMYQLIESLKSPRKEYMMISSKVRRFNRMNVKDRKEIVTLYNKMNDALRFSDLERCFIQGIALVAYSGEYIYDSAERIAGQLLKKSPDTLPENACLALIEYLAKTRRIGLAEKYFNIAKLRSDINDVDLQKELEKLYSKINGWKRKPYLPASKENRESFLSSIITINT